ncbi:MAG: hypothetical protein ACXVBL_19105 [Bdellovibrionota bacterium]
MKTWMLGALLLNLNPQPWTDLNIGDKLLLTEKITLGENGPSFPAGTALQFQSSEPLAIPGAPVLYLSLTETKCEHPEWASETQIIVPQGNTESNSVGVELERNCRWGIYVEQKDLFQPSFLSKPE